MIEATQYKPVFSILDASSGKVIEDYFAIIAVDAATGSPVAVTVASGHFSVELLISFLEGVVGIHSDPRLTHGTQFPARRFAARKVLLDRQYFRPQDQHTLEKFFEQQRLIALQHGHSVATSDRLLYQLDKVLPGLLRVTKGGEQNSRIKRLSLSSPLKKLSALRIFLLETYQPEMDKTSVAGK